MTRLLDITNQTHRWTEQNIHIDTNDIYTYQNRWTDQTDCQIKLDRLTEQTRLTHEQIMLKPSVRLAEGMISHMYRPDSNIIVSLFNNV